MTTVDLVQTLVLIVGIGIEILISRRRMRRVRALERRVAQLEVFRAGGTVINEPHVLDDQGRCNCGWYVPLDHPDFARLASAHYLATVAETERA